MHLQWFFSSILLTKSVLWLIWVVCPFHWLDNSQNTMSNLFLSAAKCRAIFLFFYCELKYDCSKPANCYFIGKNSLNLHWCINEVHHLESMPRQLKINEDDDFLVFGFYGIYRHGQQVLKASIALWCWHYCTECLE